MPAFLDLTGKTFGRLRVLSRVPPRYWQCACECNTTTIVRADSLVEGRTKSCGCLQQEWREKPKGKRLSTGTFAKFEQKIRKTSGCWIWTGSINPTTGYGRFHIGFDKNIFAHRYSYIHFKGKIPKGKILRHTCDNKRCVNPEHIIIGTYQDNSNDAVQRGLVARGLSHGMVKFTPSIIIKVYKAKGTTAEIAAQFGMSRPHVDRIKKKETWTHILENLT